MTWRDEEISKRVGGVSGSGRVKDSFHDLHAQVVTFDMSSFVNIVI